MAAMMRFDDRVATLLASRPQGAVAREAAWSQLADSLAQAGQDLPETLRETAMARLLQWRDDVSIARKRVASAALSNSRTPPEIVALFASDADEVAAPMLARARLPDDAWLALIPRLSRGSRNLLRRRGDLPFIAARALQRFAGQDQGLPGEVTETPASQPIQIRDLVARIEAYRRSHVVPPASSDEGLVNEFRFETTPDGLISWAGVVEPASLVGVSISEIAPTDATGADRQLEEAFRLRQADGTGRLLIREPSPLAGAWQVRLRPVFRPVAHFAGVRGIAKREKGAAGGGLLAGILQADSVRQLAHELRTPLNAIRGFAELIEGQFMGPAPRSYRERAADIVADARSLTAVIADLDDAARLEMSALAPSAASRCDPSVTLRRALGALRRQVDRAGVRLLVTAPVGLSAIAMGDDEAETLFRRVVALVLNFSQDDEPLRVSLSDGPRPVLTLDRPVLLPNSQGKQASVAGSATDRENMEFLPLGFPFSWRLTESFAAAHGATLRMEAGQVLVLLPPANAPNEAMAA